MTAEIGILNKQGLVLAADSAVTIGNQRVFNTSNKVFTLGTNQFVGIMVYGNAEFMQHPWSLLFTEYKKSIGDCRKNTLEEYGKDFIDFIRNGKRINTLYLQEIYIKQYTRKLYNGIRKVMDDKVLSIDSDAINNIKPEIKDVLKSNCTELETQTMFNISYSEHAFLEGNKDTILSTLKKLKSNSIGFDSEYLDEILDESLTDFLHLAYLGIMTGLFDDYSGIVIAGYGINDLFPSIITYKMYCTLDNTLIYDEDKNNSAKVGPIATDKLSTASIIPFAQGDVAQTILTGIAPQLTEGIDEALNSINVNEDSAQKFFKALSKVQRSKFIEPMVDSVTSMTIQELSDVAETLISLTEFKRKYTSSLATVGGPVDILAITNTEGPVWIKQKHYFDLAKNPEFSKRRGF